MSRWLFAGSVACVSFVAGCSANSYVYRPAEQATANVGGLPAARYGVPPEKPTGSVLVASPGIVEMKFGNDSKTRALSVRMVVANNADEAAWKVDTREQRAVVAGGGQSAPFYVNSDGQDSPVVEVARGQKRTVDLYYPMPASANDAKHVPEFDVLWQVHTGERVVTERTPFDRLEVEPVYASPYGDAWSYGPFWWHDPFWPAATYAISPAFRYAYPPPLQIAPIPPPPGR